MTKTVKITSRGRYVCPDGKVLFGPTGTWFKEDTNTLKALLTSYPTITIVERTDSKKLVNINIANVLTNNESEPVSMMEDVKPANQEQDQTQKLTLEGADLEVVQDTVEIVEVPASEVVEPEVTIETTQAQTEVVEEVPVSKVVETAQNPEAEVVEKEEVVAETSETVTEVKEDGKVESPVEPEKTPNTTNQQSKKNKKKNNKSTEVTPKEA